MRDETNDRTPATAVVVMDMLNTYDHDDAELLAMNVEPMVPSLSELIQRARTTEGVQLVFVNDSHGDFTATRDDIVARALTGRRPDLVKPLLPIDDCAFLPKVRHSAFFGTPLEYLLRRERIETVVLAGQVTEQCVLYSALDAYIREFAVRVASNCVAAIHSNLGKAALEMIERNMRGEVRPAEACL
ncbi:cysteine hydrolase [Streptosporangiaceae bacterium NEAU-GS5]|nr:cysteine hydrolase [Streptosporangiaceae bacterium NEAU-GS5]